MKSGGGPRRAFRIYSIRPLTQTDLQYISVPKTKRLISRIRDSHHNIARLAALGLSTTEIARRTGYSLSRCSLLMGDPSMRELIEQYRGKITDEYLEGVDEYREAIFGNMMKAERQLSDKLDEADAADEPLPVRDLIAISRDGADRLGYGKKSTNVNLNVDFAAKLEEAIARSKKLKEIPSDA